MEIQNKFEALTHISEERNPNEMWSELKNTVKVVAEQVIPKAEYKKKTWIKDETFELIKQKRAAKELNKIKYDYLKGEVQRMLRKDKQEEIDNLCLDIENHMKRGNTRPAYQSINKLTRRFQPKNIAIKDAKGVKLISPIEVGERWREYCENLYDDDESDETEIVVNEREPPPCKAKIKQAMQKLAKRKSPGPDDVPAELLQYGGDVVIDLLHEICLKVWESGTWPDDWTRSLFVPLPKKGDILQCSNHRTIALVSHAN